MVVDFLPLVWYWLVFWTAVGWCALTEWRENRSRSLVKDHVLLWDRYGKEDQ